MAPESDPDAGEVRRMQDNITSSKFEVEQIEKGDEESVEGANDYECAS